MEQNEPGTHRAPPSRPCGFALRAVSSEPAGLPSSAARHRAVRDSRELLIPARNEEQTIRSTLEAALATEGLDFEVIVLDDHSTDRTAEIVTEIARSRSSPPRERRLAAGLPHPIDPQSHARLRLEKAPPLPAGWCGKQHACYVLAQLARHPLLLFLDADVRLAPDALRRMSQWMTERKASLASGVPRQELGTFSERLLIPLIHFILLGFLPMHAMRFTRLPSVSAGCGQLFIARRDAYDQCGGHSMIPDSLHDGLKLPRVFRAAGFPVELFDASDLAVCRMYQTQRQTWRGLGKNATEGLAAPQLILPFTAILLGGQVLPWLLLALAPALSQLTERQLLVGLPQTAVLLTTLAVAFSLLPRLLAARRFRQPWASALLHPLGVLALLSIQWHALWRQCRRQPCVWKGRSYAPATSGTSRVRWVHPVLLTALFLLFPLRAWPADPQPLPNQAPRFIELQDQYEAAQKLSFPRQKLTVLTIADRKGSDQVNAWVTALKPACAGKAEIWGIANLGGAPPFLRAMIRKKFRQTHPHSVMLDWSGEISSQLGARPGVANILLVATDGRILRRFTGQPTDTELRRAMEEIKAALAGGSRPVTARP